MVPWGGLWTEMTEGQGDQGLRSDTGIKTFYLSLNPVTPV